VLAELKKRRVWLRQKAFNMAKAVLFDGAISGMDFLRD
jgi:hypothetical protein